MRQVTLSLKDEEYAAIEKIMQKTGMKRHEVIKFILRRYLFPQENVVPLNGRVAEPYPPYEGHMRVRDQGITVYETEEELKKATEK